MAHDRPRGRRRGRTRVHVGGSSVRVSLEAAGDVLPERVSLELEEALLDQPAITVMAAPAFATTSRWAWTMEHRFVSGEENGVLHEIDEGRMSFEGEVWAFAKKRGPHRPPW